jgi:hypothetical protein
MATSNTAPRDAGKKLAEFLKKADKEKNDLRTRRQADRARSMGSISRNAVYLANHDARARVTPLKSEAYKRVHRLAR